ncbi:hypothetical protein GCM10018782_25490 [Streptomyces griseoaurantiacus]|nr:hypothetical protein GCM10018782_25490 [Streptomyces griseoaurantiacus]
MVAIRVAHRGLPRRGRPPPGPRRPVTRDSPGTPARSGGAAPGREGIGASRRPDAVVRVRKAADGPDDAADADDADGAVGRCGGGGGTGGSDGAGTGDTSATRGA